MKLETVIPAKAGIHPVWVAGWNRRAGDKPPHYFKCGRIGDKSLHYGSDNQVRAPLSVIGLEFRSPPYRVDMLYRVRDRL